MSATIPNTWRMIGRKLGGSKQVALALLIIASACRTSELRAKPAQKEGKTEPAPADLVKVDVHLHIDLRSADEALSILREHHIAIGLNASGGEVTRGLEASRELAQRSKGALQPLCNIALFGFDDPRYPEYVAESLRGCVALGGKGLKIPKLLGLGLTDEAGKLAAVDDPRLDVLFEAAGKLGLPVLIHSGDPKAFFEPPTPDNERYEELRVHPGWSFYGNGPDGRPWPSWTELLDQHERRIARHPNTIFVGAHFGNAAEDPDRVSRMLKRYPNYVIDTAARVPEFGRHDPGRMRAFFIEHQDRILFGSDLGVGGGGLTLGSGGEKPGTREESRAFFARQFLYFETAGRRMPSPTPIQGNWTIDGIDLPQPVLKKLYSQNAARIFKLTLPQTN
jgi:predicted TIM-barrel fold metal-dependent hydrolase